jgi:hypothetical protein
MESRIPGCEKCTSNQTTRQWNVGYTQRFESFGVVEGLHGDRWSRRTMLKFFKERVGSEGWMRLTIHVRPF